jgi:hypothetical protein
MRHSERTYTTQDELEYIDNMSDRENKKGEVIVRGERLINYKRTLEKNKKNWKGVNKEEVITYLDQKIAEEKKKKEKI